MKIVEFYRGERRNHVGDLLKHMMEFSLREMEDNHDFIQWMFPSNEPSQMNDEAPVLTLEESEIFKNDPELQKQVEASFRKFLNFLGLELIESPIPDIFPLFIMEKMVIALKPTTERPYPIWWMDDFNHNMLRITRVLKCLRLTGLDTHAKAFFVFLSEHKFKFSPNTFGHWERATNDPLW